MPVPTGHHLREWIDACLNSLYSALDLYRAYGIDTEAILDAAARACLTAMRHTQ